MKKQKRDGKFFVKVSCIIGLFVLLFFLSIFVWTGLRSHTGIFGFTNQFSGVTFNEKLRQFDELFAPFSKTGKQPDIAFFSTLLTSLEKSAVGAEGQLSVLKRKRLLVKAVPFFLPEYAKSAERAAEKFPHNALIAALAGEALINISMAQRETNAVYLDDRESVSKLINYAETLSGSGPFTEQSFIPLAFAFYSLCGAMADAQSAGTIAKIEDLFISVLKEPQPAAFAPLSINAALLQILEQNYDKADAFIIPLNALFSGVETTAKARDFLANYAYDFGDLILAARFWTESARSEDIARAADALYLAKRYENALQLWNMLTGSRTSSAELRLKTQALYNIARISHNVSEQINALEILLAESGGRYASAATVYGLVLYTRLVPAERSNTILEEAIKNTGHTLFDLELFRQQLRLMPIDSAVGQTWPLIERHLEDSRVYEWAAWFFDFQRRYEETAFLSNIAEKRRISGFWRRYSNILDAILSENYNRALELLSMESGIVTDNECWSLYANKGLLHEARRDYNSALSDFQTARNLLSLQGSEFSIDANSREKNAARLELKISRCLTIQGRNAEAREAVRNAVRLDGDNINVRIAAERLGERL